MQSYANDLPPVCSLAMFGGNSDEGCDHSDHSAESDADSPDTDSGHTN